MHETVAHQCVCTQHWGIARFREVPHQDTMSAATLDSIGGMLPSPTASGSCITASVRANTFGRIAFDEFCSADTKTDVKSLH